MLCNNFTTFCLESVTATNSFMMISIASGREIADEFDSVVRKDILHEVSE